VRPNVLIPLVTLVSVSLPGLFGGSVVIELVCGWPGIGSMVLQAVNQRDYPILVGMNLIIAALVLASSLLADILYAVIDPRIRFA
jgi:peptide/nickel transport system permease protein